jgi:prepilin-type N-terminal cleavage/methylation domain-containing protein
MVGPRVSDKTLFTAGFTLVELLVGLLISGVLLGVVARDFAMTARARGDLEVTMETQQGVQAAVAALTQEVRQAGACLPQSGTFISMEAVDDGTEDALTFRTGVVDPDTLTCIRAVLPEGAEEGDTEITVDKNDGFEQGQLVYITGSSGDGEAFYINQASGTNLLALDRALPRDLPKGGGVYAIESRTYRIEPTNDGESMMTVAIDGGEPQPLVQGAEELDFQYRLTPCPPCESVSLPYDDVEWHNVREIVFTVTVRSIKPTRGGDYVRLTRTTTVRPRNFL